ncbi:efflux RND transporter periplasmic adaptor subunit [Thiorhodovibrio frisius]|uniref:RND family efflux transporter, MFP subunit n=1 Tax=Thiorhodovibrio frisius TaxID=631362 RepID=H8Z5H4_9GAMM|nr:efflux RND transporter periplasmic adaptor subunit [Thiorhodovibrio frisius]EIC19520.1 RND family efflux transporter, MFP subunit [Thiorhodovibrio frisius]WPL20517.1 multidrug efflux system protein MdtE [Thiorhodovibrio frisius]
MGFKAKPVLTAASSLLAVTVLALPGLVREAIASDEAIVVRQAEGFPTMSVGGTVMPYKEVTFAAQMPGRVKFIAGIEGDSFDQDAVLVSIDASELEAKREALFAQMASADSQIRNADVQYNRELYSPRSKSAPGGMGVPNLFDQMLTRPMEDFIGERDQGAEEAADLYASRTQVREAHHQMMRLQAELRALDSKLRDARSIAPFDGVIVSKLVEVGDTVQPGQPLLKFADMEFLQVEVDVPARLRSGLREGMMLRAELDIPASGPGARAGASPNVPVRIAQIFPMADPQRHTIKVKFDLPQGTSEPGMYATVLVPDFNVPARTSPVVPRSAIRYNGSLPGVYVLDENGLPQLRLVRVGDTTPEGGVSILSGLRAGERILANPGPGIASGWSSRPTGDEKH